MKCNLGERCHGHPRWLDRAKDAPHNADQVSYRLQGPEVPDAAARHLHVLPSRHYPTSTFCISVLHIEGMPSVWKLYVDS